MENINFNWIDITLAVFLVWSLIKGFRKGFVIELATLAALILGIYGALKFADVTAEYLTYNIDLPEDYTPLIAFVVTFVVIVIAVHLLARMLDKMIKMVALGFLNRFAGAVFSLLKTALFLSFILFFIESIDQTVQVIPQKTKKESVLYYPLTDFAFRIIPAVTRSGYFESLEKEYDKMKKELLDFELPGNG